MSATAPSTCSMFFRLKFRRSAECGNVAGTIHQASSCILIEPLCNWATRQRRRVKDPYMASKPYYTMMAVPAAEVPKDFLSSGTLPKGDELVTGSRKDWLRGAISTCPEHFHCADLSHLLEEKAVVCWL